jgi:AcrR family transcriptional regulator
MDITSPQEGRSYGGLSPAERTRRRHQAFLEAGLRLMGSVGYRATTVRALCREAGLTDRYFYESFSGTEQLLCEVYDTCIARLQGQVLASLSGAVAGESLDTRLVRALEAFFGVVEDPCLARIVWLEVLGVSAVVDARYHRAITSFADIALAYARARHPDWQVSDQNGHLVSLAAVGAINQSAMSWLLSGYAAPRAAVVRANALVVSGLLAEVGRRQALGESFLGADSLP